MIRQRDIEKYRFYTTDGTDMWRVKSVSTFTLVELVNCETGGTASARVGEKSAGGFTAVKMPKTVKSKSRVANRKSKKKQGTREKAKQAMRKSGKGVRKGGTATSKYFGVSIDKRASKKKVQGAGEP